MFALQLEGIHLPLHTRPFAIVVSNPGGDEPPETLQKCALFRCRRFGRLTRLKES